MLTRALPCRADEEHLAACLHSSIEQQPQQQQEGTPQFQQSFTSGQGSSAGATALESGFGSLLARPGPAAVQHSTSSDRVLGSRRGVWTSTSTVDLLLGSISSQLVTLLHLALPFAVDYVQQLHPGVW